MTKPPAARPPLRTATASAGPIRTRAGLPVLTLVFVAGLGAGWIFHHSRNAADATGGQVPPSEALPAAAEGDAAAGPKLLRRERRGLAHPLLGCEGNSADAQTTAIRAAIVQSIETSKLKRGLAGASVVYQELDNCRGFSIKPERVYRPASLLKLPLAMAVMRKAVTSPGILDREETFLGQTMREDSGPQGLVSGQKYSVRELLGRMIRWSRNDAKAVLAAMLGEPELRAIYEYHQVPWPYGDAAADAKITVQHYARMLMTLYDASWLDPDASDLLLRLLSESEHKAALPAGVAAGITVAHKWGHRLVPGAEPAAAHQFHDCGIIYLPNRPTLLCVMTEGRDEPGLHAAIADIARQAVK